MSLRRSLLPSLLALAVACGGALPPEDDDPQDAGEITFDAGSSADAATSGGADASTDDPPEPEPEPEPWWLEGDDDFDGDGVSAAAGDCHDGEPTVRPGVPDLCNDVDDDCDGRTDEDVNGDATAPGLDSAQELGDLTYEDERLIEGLVFPATDVDRWVMRVDDVLLRNFDLEAWVYGVPREADFVLELYWISDADGRPRGLVQRADLAGPGGYEVINHGGSASVDDSGRYELVLRSKSGAGCRFPYQLQILIGGV